MNIFFKTKTREQKIIIIMTIIASLSGIFIFSNNIFTNIRFVSYFSVNIIIGILQFVILQFFLNKNRIKNNALVSIPFIGFINACFIFLKKP
jgi:hypothetical protein